MIANLICGLRPEVSLFPCVQSMAISAQQFNIIHICSPVLKSPSPGIASVLWSDFSIWVYMVNIKRPVVIKSTFNAFPAKSGDNFQLSFPVPAFLVDFIPFFVPIRFLAFWVTKSCCAHLAAIKTNPVSFPSFSHIAIPVAIFSSAVFQAVGVNFKRLGAVLASNSHFVWGHWIFLVCVWNSNYTKIHRKIKTLMYFEIDPDYFEIACARIEKAQRQGRMDFEEAAA